MSDLDDIMRGARAENFRVDIEPSVLWPIPQPAERRRSASYLTPHQMRRLDAACIPVVRAFGFGTVVLVGSALTRLDYRDVDVRAVIADEDFDQIFPGVKVHKDGGAHYSHLWAWICMCASGEISHASGMNVDFQIQRRTEASGYDGSRIPLGCRWNESEPA